MTFTEAAVEVLRRAGKPLHFKDIATVAVQENLLSHVGQDPEVTMGQRLAAMAKREEDRKVVAVSPDGTFALIEWGVPPEAIVEPVAPPLHPPEPEQTYRPREREPRAIHAQARRRLQELQAEHEPDSVLTQEAEKERVARDEREKQRRLQKGQRRFPPPAEVVFEALAQRQSGAPLKELAEGLLEKSLLSDALVRDLPSLVNALLEDNRRRTEAGRKPAFIVDGERISLVEFPPPPVAGAFAEYERAPTSGLGRPPTSAQLVAETRRAAARALRLRIGELDTSGFEHVCAALLEKMGMRDVRVAKRGKEGPLYLARQRRGLSDLRVAVRLVRGAREIGRQDVQELRKDLAHYSAQMGLVVAPGEASREARAEASAAGQPPVALYVGEALADEMVALRVGVTVQVVELVDVDEAFFQRSSGERRPQRRDEQPGQPAAAGPSAEGQAQPDEQPSPSDEAPTPELAGVEPRTAELPVAPAADEAPEAALTEGDPRDEERDRDRNRGRGRGRDDREPRRSAPPSEQAWGQPAGTPRAPGVPYGPIVLEGGPLLTAPLKSPELASTGGAPAAAEGRDVPPTDAAPEQGVPAPAPEPVVTPPTSDSTEPAPGAAPSDRPL